MLITISGNLWKNGNGGVVLQCEEQRAKSEEQRAKSKEWDGAIVLLSGRQPSLANGIERRIEGVSNPLSG